MEQRIKKIKSYVLRAGRVSPRQQQGLDLWLRDYELSLSDKPWNLAAEFNNQADIILEIGFGMGASLVSMACDNPDLNYIGIEVHQAGVGSLAADLHDKQLKNVRIVPRDAVEVLHTQIEDGALAGVQIFFPDPWHKSRHHKRRLIQPEFIQLLVRKIRSSGFIHCATDWQNYAEYMMEVLTAELALTNQSGPGMYALRPETRPLTKFEQRGKRLGHGVWDLVFVKK